MRERAHLIKPEQPRNLGHVQFAVMQVTNCQIVPQLFKYFTELQFFFRKLSSKRPLRQLRAGGYRVNFRDGNEATAYYTDNLEDAVDTATNVARE
jgi:hypothetical protein